MRRYVWQTRRMRNVRAVETWLSPDAPFSGRDWVGLERIGGIGGTGTQLAVSRALWQIFMLYISFGTLFEFICCLPLSMCCCDFVCECDDYCCCAICWMWIDGCGCGCFLGACSLVFAGESGQTCSCGHWIGGLSETADISLPNGNGGLGRRFATDRVTSFIYRFYFLKPYAHHLNKCWL